MQRRGWVLSLGIALSASAAPPAPRWDRLPPLPDPQGFAGSYAGVSGGALLVAGGANFPGKKPWEGGNKVWHNRVFVLETAAGPWRPAGRLPRPLGYGVSATYRDAVICVGGSDTARHYADCFRLQWRRGKLTVSRLPPLPRPLANGAGALVGDALYVAGGQETAAGLAVRQVYRLDLAAARPRWSVVPGFPGAPRILAAAAAFRGDFWLVGGAALAPGVDGKPVRRYLRDAYRFTPGKGWRREPDLPRALVASPSPAPSDTAGFRLLGGDDGSRLGSPPETHPGFDPRILRWEPIPRRWMEDGALPAARVTTPCVRWRKGWVLPTGEARPGVRSPEVWRERGGVPQ